MYEPIRFRAVENRVWHNAMPAVQQYKEARAIAKNFKAKDLQIASQSGFIPT